jgi:hypothetical protein
MRFLRSSGLHVPRGLRLLSFVGQSCQDGIFRHGVYRRYEAQRPVAGAGGTGYRSVLSQLAQLESRMMSIPFPAGGSLYYTNDLDKVAGRTGIPLRDERFCVGPDARLHMWYGKRSQHDVPGDNVRHSLPFLLLN